MRSSILIAGAILIWALPLGCDSATSLATRLESALAVHDSALKSVSLQAVALDAAQAGDKEVCKKAIEGITVSSIGDETAADCLQTFRRAGRVDIAIEMAKLIKARPRRDKVLSDLSQ